METRQSNYFRSSGLHYAVLCLLLLALAGYSIFRATLPTHWSAWPFDAQTLLSVRTWQKEGIGPNKLLFVPQGYSHLTRLFDRDDLIHHAHGSGHPGGNHFSRAYTHYPMWFALPYYLLSLAGIYGKTIYQVITAFESIVALGFFYFFLIRYFSPGLALMTIAIYAVTPFFQNFSDSLCGMAFNELFRFSFIYFYARRYELGRWGQLFPYVLYFLAMMVSLDNVAFIPLWAVFFDLAEKRMSWKLPFRFAFVLVVALGLQLGQIALYRGIEWAVWDWTTLLKKQPEIGPPLFSLTGLSFLDYRLSGVLWQLGAGTFTHPGKVLLAIGLTFLLAGRFVPNFLRVGVAFFVAGIGYAMLLPNKSIMDYQTVQLAPLIALSAAAFFSSVWAWIREFHNWKKSLPLAVFGSFAVAGGVYLWVPSLVKLSGQFRFESQMVPHFIEGTRYASQLNRFFPGEKMIFQLPMMLPVMPAGPKGYPQVHPLMEYHADAPILTFDDIDLMIKDVLKLSSEKKYEIPFLILATGADIPIIERKLSPFGKQIEPFTITQLGGPLILKVF